MGLKMIVMVKQVPDTQNISSEAMKPDGTVNRSALPAIINPDDLNALEEALKIKECCGGTVIAVSMGPPNAIESLRECLYRGTDDAVLLSDRNFAGADTLATSYTLQCAANQIGEYDLVLCGQQAIDGDTAQVGPQLAEKLGINQITGVSEIVEITESSVCVKRSIEDGYEIVKSRFPVLLTVTAQANDPRPPSAKRMMTYKNIASKRYDDTSDSIVWGPDHRGILSHVKEWTSETIQADHERCGISGSPTRVKTIESVVLSAKDLKQIPDTDTDIAGMFQELLDAHIIG